jgi:hypothetical protein
LVPTQLLEEGPNLCDKTESQSVWYLMCCAVECMKLMRKAFWAPEALIHRIVKCAGLKLKYVYPELSPVLCGILLSRTV